MATETFTGHRGLDMDEPLIFEQGAAGMSGVDLPGAGEFEDRLGDAGRESETGLPGLSAVRGLRQGADRRDRRLRVPDFPQVLPFSLRIVIEDRRKRIED